MIRWWQSVALRLALAGLVLLAAGLAVPIAAAEPGKVFEVHGVRVDVTAATAAAAKDQALAEAELKAFELLFDRLAPARQRAALGQIPPAQIQSATKSFWVSDEKVSSVRYLAKLNYAFRPERIRAIAQQAGVPLITQVSPRVLVVPVYEAGGRQQVWDPTNPWLRAWADVRADGLVPIVVPTTDSAEAGVLNAQQATAPDSAALAALAQRYSVFEVLVVVATEAAPQRATGGAGALKVTANRRPSFAPQTETSAIFKPEAAETADDLLKRAAAATLRAVEEDWKNANLVQGGEGGVAMMDVATSDIASWLAIRARLEKLPTVERVEALLFARDHVRVHVYHNGSPAELGQRLERGGFAVSSSGGVWIVRPAPGPGQGQRFPSGRS